MSDSVTQDNQSDGIVCPTCGKSDFKSEQGMKSHHAMAHGESIAHTTFNCDNCGAEKTVTESDYQSSNNNFCSVKCKSEWQSGQAREWGRKIPNRFQDSDYLQELYWGRGFSTTEIAGMAGVSRHTISRWMDRLSIERRPVGKGDGHFQYNRAVVECNICGASMTRKKSRIERNERHFCSFECAGVWRSENFVGDDHPRWNGGTPIYNSGEWQRTRETVFDKCGGACLICGLTRQGHQGKYGEDLHVHHIQPVATFDDVDKANKLDNLIPLCKGCHNRWEGIPLRPSVI